MSKSNLLKTNFCIQNSQVFSLHRLNLQRFPTLWLYLKFSLYRISVYSVFGLNRLHCTWYSTIEIKSRSIVVDIMYCQYYNFFSNVIYFCSSSMFQHSTFMQVCFSSKTTRLLFCPIILINNNRTLLCIYCDINTILKCSMPTEKLSIYIISEQITFWSDDDDICFILDQQPDLDFNSFKRTLVNCYNLCPIQLL